MAQMLGGHSLGATGLSNKGFQLSLPQDAGGKTNRNTHKKTTKRNRKYEACTIATYQRIQIPRFSFCHTRALSVRKHRTHNPRLTTAVKGNRPCHWPGTSPLYK